ncbi:MAG: TetR family transcriptional regulator [Candidatus Nanopelagicales bacterium]
MGQQLSLRQRNRLASMRLVQRSAVTLMEAHGFDMTTVEEIAETSGVSASTIYRHFGTKENLVLWDEQNTAVDAELTRRLPREPVLTAFRDGVIAALVDRPDRDLFLRRLQLVYAVPSIWAVAAHADRTARTELAAGIAAVDGRRVATTADKVVAAGCLAALDVALDAWQASNGAQRLEDLICEAIAAMAALG